MTDKNNISSSASIYTNETPIVKSRKHFCRKSKKNNEKELLGMYFSDGLDNYNTESSNTNVKTTAQYLSQRERNYVEQKFTTPKNIHQEQYVAMLKHKQKKIIVVAGPVSAWIGGIVSGVNLIKGSNK